MSQVYCPKCKEHFSSNCEGAEGWYVDDDLVDELDALVKRYFAKPWDAKIGHSADFSPALDLLSKQAPLAFRCPKCGNAVIEEREDLDATVKNGGQR